MRSLKMIKTDDNVNEEPLKIDTVKQYKEDFLEMLENREKYINYSIDRLKEYIAQEFEQRKNKVLKELDKSVHVKDGDDAKAFFLNIGLPFTDQTKHLQDKLTNVLHTKQFYINISNELAQKTKLSEEELAIAKRNFDLVCDYNQRRDNLVKSEELYTIPLAKYLITKCFKKSATDSYALVSCHPLKTYFKDVESTLKIVSIAGGPGSDLTGVLCYLMELGFFKFECRIFDFNCKNWAEVSGEVLVNAIKGQAKKVYGRIPEITIEWKFCDIKTPFEKKEDIPTGDIFFTCWALNESIFNNLFWEELITKNENSYLFFVDGDRYPIENIRSFESLKNRKFIYEGLETPRRVAIFPIQN